MSGSSRSVSDRPTPAPTPTPPPTLGRRWLWVLDRQAVIDALPLAVGAIPFALVTGVTATRSQLPTPIAWLTSPLIFAGAAQLTLLTIAGTATMLAAIAAVAVVNARHVMYSAALAPEFQRHPRWFRAVGSGLLIDQNFALSLQHVGSNPAHFRRYYLTASLLMYSNWVVMTGIGVGIGPALPSAWRLEFCIPVMFLALTVGVVKSRPEAIAAAVGAVVGFAASGLPDRLGIICGAVAGVAAGVVASALTSRSTDVVVNGSPRQGSRR